MQQEYFVIYSYSPISLQNAKELSKLGIITPYDSANVEMNVYAYLPCEMFNADVKQGLRNTLTGGFQILPQRVNAEVIKKHVSKIAKVNKVNVGDLVYYAPLKKLPLTITLLNDGIATIFHQLRDESICYEVNVEELYPADDVNQDNLYFTGSQFPLCGECRNYTLLIDCDSFVGAKNLQRLLQITLQAKSLYADSNVVLLNPDDKQREFANHFGLSCVVASANDLQHFNREHCILVSNTLYLGYFLPTITFNLQINEISDNPMFNFIKGLKLIEPRLSCDYAYHQYKCRGVLDPKVEKYRKSLSDCGKPYISCVNDSTQVDIPTLKLYIRSIGCLYLAEVAQDILTLLHKQGWHNLT